MAPKTVIRARKRANFAQLPQLATVLAPRLGDIMLDHRNVPLQPPPALRLEELVPCALQEVCTPPASGNSLALLAKCFAPERPTRTMHAEPEQDDEKTETRASGYKRRLRPPREGGPMPLHLRLAS